MSFKRYALVLLTTTFLSNGHSCGILPNPDLESVKREISVGSFSKVFEHVQDFKEDDVVFLNIDGVLLSKGTDKKTFIPVDRKKIKSFLKILHKKKVTCFGVTSRSYEDSAEIFKGLSSHKINFDKNYSIDFLDQQAQYYKGILFSSPLQDADQKKISTTSKAVVNFMAYLKGTDQKFKRAVFIDSKTHASFKGLDELKILQFQRKFKAFYSSFSENKLDLSTLSYVETKSGGSGGVAVLQDPLGKKWTLKSWQNRDHGINECLAGLLYKEMGGYSPDFTLYNDLPKDLKKQIIASGFNIYKSGLYRLADYIEGETASVESIRQQGRKNFLPTALISFWDIKPDNYRMSATGELYLIDTGGSFLYRSLGRPKGQEAGWTPYQVSDLASLKQAGNFGHAVFEGLHPQEMGKELEAVLCHKSSLLEKLKDFCHATQYQDKAQLRQLLESRLNHFQLLKDFYEGSLNPKADPFALALEQDAAGTLVYTHLQDKPHLLIGKRAGHKWWGNLGGKADQGEYLYQTATRETQEESGGMINIDPKEMIKSAPSHDALYIDEEGLLRRYRTYLIAQDPLDLSQMKDKEYTDYKWVPIQNILQALYQKEWITEENTQTLKLEEGIILHPPFVESLQQSPVKGWLEDLMQGRSILPTCTQSVVGHENLTLLQDQDPFTTSDSKHQQHLLDLDKDIVLKYPLMSEVLPAESKSTASYRMLDHLHDQLEHKDETASVQQKIKEVTNQYLSVDDQQAQLIKHIIQQEQRHGDQHVLYHGLESEVWFCYRVLSHLRHMVDQTTLQTSVLRSLDSFFDQFPTAMDLLNYIIKGNNNYSAGFQAVGISCNPTLLSNLKVSSSSTLRYFLQSYSNSPPSDIWNIIAVLTDSLGLSSEPFIDQLKTIFQKHLYNKPGCLVQFFLDPEIVNQACYPSGSIGSVLLDSQTNTTIRNSQNVLNFLKTGEGSFSLTNRRNVELGEERERIQFRLHSNLSKFGPDKIRIYDYFADGDQSRLQKIDQEIHSILKNNLWQIMQGLSFDNTVYGTHVPSLLQNIRKKAGIKSYEIKAEPRLVKALQGQNHKEVLKFYVEDPTQFQVSYKDADTLRVIRGEENSFVKNLKACPSEFIQYLQTINSKLSIKSVHLAIITEFRSQPQPNHTKSDIEKSIKIAMESTLLEKILNESNKHFLAHIKELGDNAQEIIEIAVENNLIREGIFSTYIDDILKIIKDLGEDKKHIIEIAVENKFINEQMDSYQIENILKFIKDLGKDRKQIVAITEKNKFIGKSFSKVDREILTFLKNLGEERKQIVEVAVENEFIQENMISYEILNILKELGEERRQIVEVARENKLIQKEMIPSTINVILNALKELGEERKQIVKISRENELIREGMNFYDIVELLNTLKELGEERKQIVEIVGENNLIKEKKRFQEILDILQFIKNLGEDRKQIVEVAKENELIQEGMNFYDIVDILNCIKNLGEDRKQIVEVAKENELIQKSMSFYKVEPILNTVKELGQEWKKIIKISKENKLIQEEMEAESIGKILNIVKNLGKEREQIVKIAVETGLLKEDMESYEIEFALENLSNDRKKNK